MYIKNYVKTVFKKNISKFIFVSTGIDTEISERIIKIKKSLTNFIYKDMNLDIYRYYQLAKQIAKNKNINMKVIYLTEK